MSKPRICSFESRRAEEMARMIEKLGGQPTVAPSMQEVPLGENPAAFAFAERLFAGEIDITIFMTGVGATALLNVIETKFDRQQFLNALNEHVVVVRGPKPAAVLKKLGVSIFINAAEPNTWREILSGFSNARMLLAGTVIAVQEYGIANEEFYAELKQRGATVVPVPVYRWTLPDDVGPLQEAIQRTIAGEFDALMFTSANQVRNVLQVASEQKLDSEWLAAANNCTLASVGPTCSETMKSLGLRIDFEASPPKMGPLVRGTIETVNGR